MQKPWITHYDPGTKESLRYPDRTLFEMLVRTENLFPNQIALSFEGREMTYRTLLLQVDTVALALEALGMKKGDSATICLPNTPHAVVMFYAVNKIGAIANMVHPKTPAFELKEFMTETASEYLIVLDAFMAKHVQMLSEIPVRFVIAAAIGDYLSVVKRAGFFVAKGRKIPSIPDDPKYISWKELNRRGLAVQSSQKTAEPPIPYSRPMEPNDPAVYLHSGGTTGSPKTIVLSSHNMNVLAVQGHQIVNIPDPFETGVAPLVSMITILPLFHGFGLCMGLHTMICNGITAILVPQFTPDSMAKVIIKEKPSFMAAVPTLYEGILSSARLRKANLSFIRCCFCGGDSLTPELKDRFEAFVRERGANISLREGYGLTETVTVCCVNPENKSRKDSIGLPLPDILMKIVETGTHISVPNNTQGEICVSGPTTMLTYLRDPKATAEALHLHEDGHIWVHTGDFGYMDDDGYFYFTQRLKRIIKVSGIPVFPSQIEAIISRVKGVASVCAVAIPDPYRMHVVKAILVPGDPCSEEERTSIKEAVTKVCEEQLIPYARPVEIEFREQLPLTLVGKIDYVALEKEETERRAQALS
jgi:long-chain acyl-CoA synthetase